jgi:hypothetical protein
VQRFNTALGAPCEVLGDPGHGQTLSPPPIPRRDIREKFIHCSEPRESLAIPGRTKVGFVPVRTVVGSCPNCECVTHQKEVYETLADGTVVLYVTTCIVCNKDV